MPSESANPFLEIQRNVARVDPGALVTAWANLPPFTQEFTGVLFRRFDDFDVDGDGFLDTSDIETACQDPEVVGKDAAAFATARKLLAELSKCHDDFGWDAGRISRADLSGLDLRSLRDPDDGLVREAKYFYEAAQARLARAPTRVFDDPERRSFSALSCTQGMVGDCSFLASLVSMALHTPERLLPMMSQRSDDEWTVRFRDGGTAVTVATPTEAEKALFAHADGLWPAIFELAYGKHRRNSGDWAPSQYGALVRGVETTEAIRALTGNDARVVHLDRPLDEVRHALIRAMGSKRIAWAATIANTGSDPFEIEHTDDGLIQEHAYSVLSYDPDEDMVMLRNPSGGGTGGAAGSKVEKGVFWMPLPRFPSNFAMVVVEW